jgi:N-acetylmuramoyl-L-alanine amidase
VLNAPRLVVIVCCVTALIATARGMTGLEAAASPVAAVHTPTATPPMSPPTAGAAAAATPEPTSGPTHTPSPTATPTPVVPRIGIVAGHWGSDTGAMCPDGLQEVDLNLDIAQRVVGSLEIQGYTTDLLEEFDERLNGYQALALVSIHADSCEPFPGASPPASGFKVASVEDSMVPEEEARLVACLVEAYQARTGMYFHRNSITFDMTRYHTFYEVDGYTPAAIIEVGFMHEDQAMLTQRPDLVAQGIVDGILCFLEGEDF